MATNPWNQASGLRPTRLAARVSPGVERIHGTASVLLVSLVRCFLSRLGANLTSHVDRKTRRLNPWIGLLLSPSVLLVQTNVLITILPSRPSPRLKSADCSSSNLPPEKVLDEGGANQHATAGTNLKCPPPPTPPTPRVYTPIQGFHSACSFLKKKLDASRPSEHPPVRGENVKKFRCAKSKTRQNLFDKTEQKHCST